MKKILCLFLVSLVVHTVWAQSGVGYDPENPGDPDVYYRLTLEAAPRSGGEVSTYNSKMVAAGTEVYCYASAKTGYTFSRWMKGDVVVSTESSFTYTMPEENVTLTAYFDFTGYNPDSPDDPFADGYQHKVTLYATPSAGGYFNSSNFMLAEGKTANVYAYPHSGYRFVSWKQDGKIVSTQNPLEVKMGSSDLIYTATFVYDPENPGSPSPNNFNKATGELIIDDFKPGYLNSAINSAIGSYENYPLVQSIIIVGKMESYDFGFAHSLGNCSLIDLARTTGYTEIPRWAFEDMSSLTELVIPASVEKICDFAFSGCEHLSEIACYATVPPVLEPNAFANVPKGLIVRVPSSAMSLYLKTEEWKDFTLLPLDEETCSISVSLPDDAIGGRYKNMILELDNISSGQILKYLITDRTEYVFANLVRDTKYNLFVKNAIGANLGSILDVEVGKDNVNVKFDALLQPQNVSIEVFTSDNEDVTDKVNVSWRYEDGTYIGDGRSLSGLIEATKVYYDVTLPQDLGLKYLAPGNKEYIVKPSGNQLTCVLSPFKEYKFGGIIRDGATNNVLANAVVTISQRLNGKYSKSQTVMSGKDGTFSAIVYDAPMTVTIVANNYISQNFEIDDIQNITESREIVLNTITGTTISTKFTYQTSVAEGVQSTVYDYYSDYGNVSYLIYNKTKQKFIDEFKVQYPQIVLYENAEVGDVLSVTAKSKNGAFLDVVSEGTVNQFNTLELLFPIIQLGGLSATFKSTSNQSIIGILYDKNGQLVKKTAYDGQELYMTNIVDGDYTLVTMGGSKFFNSVLNIEELDNVGLVSGQDYTRNAVTIKSGIISTVEISEVPIFNESKFYYTGQNTSFTANKSSVTVGNYVTLRGKIDFKKEFENKVSDINLLFDLPESCRFVDNSLLTSKGIGSYTVSGNRICVPLDNVDEQIRFCVIPAISGDFKPNAFVQFGIEGKTVAQPIGAAYFTAENMEIIVPERTAFTSVVVKGVAMSDSKVSIYDDDVLIGQTYSYANGQWETKVELYKPYSQSFHSIHAEIRNADNQVFYTDTKSLEYDKNISVPVKITMLYNGNKIIFDQLEGKNSINSYSYVPSNSTFTFLANFTQNDTTLIKDLEFVVLASDGTIRRIPGIYNEGKHLWMAMATYGNSSRLPVNVAVDYISTYRKIDDKERYEDQFRNLELIREFIWDYAENKSSYDFFEDTDSSLVFKVESNETGKSNIIHLRLLDTGDINLDECIKVETDSLKFYIKDGFSEEDMSYVAYIYDIESQQAFSISVDCEKKMNRMVFKRQRLWGTVADVAELFVPFLEYYRGCNDYTYWVNRFSKDEEDLLNERKKTANMLLAKCPDGTLRVDERRIRTYEERWGKINDDVTSFTNTAYEMLNEWNERLRADFIFESSTACLGAIAKGALRAGALLRRTPIGKFFRNFRMGRAQREITEQHIDAVLDVTSEGVSSVFDFADFGSIHETFSEWEPKRRNEYMIEYYMLQLDITAYTGKCNEKEEEDEEDKDNKDNGKKTPIFTNPPVVPSIDPSGFVYEGVSSNRVEGVAATAYYKEITEDMYGDLHEKAVKWDAEEYAQENPLFTDENGRYAWDVPQGMWQVKFEKEGYETTYSEWLPVPPPQLDVNVAMTQVRQPEAKSVHAYKDGVEIEFDKYMIPETLTPDNIYVMADGMAVEGKTVLLNEEISYEGKDTKFASKVRFNPDKPFTAKEITLTVVNKVKSYAGIQMADNYTQTFDIEEEIKGVVADSVIMVPYEKFKTVTISVYPASSAVGKIMRAKLSSDMMLSLDKEEVEIDETGTAQFVIRGELPGMSAVTYSIDGFDISATQIVKIEVVDAGYREIPVPKSSITSGSSVYRGTKVELSTSEPKAKIYYTLDGSCPCNNVSRVLYKEPITVSSDVIIKSITVADDDTESDVATFTYSILQSNDGVGLNEGWNWVSLNMASESLANTNTALVSGTWTSDDEIKNDRYTDSYSEKQKKWMGTLTMHGGRLDNAGMYKIHSSKVQTLALSGEAVNPGETSIAVNAGWNYICYLPLVEMNLTDALVGYDAQDGDVIKSQESFAVYSSPKGWEGSLDNMRPGMGYMLKRNASAGKTEFKYPVVTPMQQHVASASRSDICYKYADNMNIIGHVSGINVMQGDSIVALVGGEIRGMCRIGNDGSVWITIHGSERKPVTLVLQRDGEFFATSSSMFGYESNKLYGLPDSPTNIDFTVNNVGESFGKIRTIYRLDGTAVPTRNIDRLSAGVYLIYSDMNGKPNVTKFTKR